MIYDSEGKPIDIDSLKINPDTEPQPTINDLIGDLESNLSGISKEEFDRSNEFYRTLSARRKELKEQNENIESPSWVYTKNFGRGLGIAEETDTLQYLDTSLRSDTEANFSGLWHATHGLAREDSAERAALDFININKAKKEKPTIIEKSEAEMRAKEAGVDLKFDKPITEGELEYSINKQLRKKELNSQIAYYRSTGDYSALQELMLMGSVLSGGMGFIETAGTIGLSLIGGAGVAWGLGKAAQVFGTTTRLSKGAFIAQRVANATRYAQSYANALQEATLAKDTIKAAKAADKLKQWSGAVSKAEGIAKRSGFVEKVGYDAYRFGLQQGGEGASVLSTAVPFAIDGAVSAVPSELMRMTADKATFANEYSAKDMIAGIAAGATLGAALPFAGAALKKVPSAFGDVVEAMQNNIARSKQEKIAEGLLKKDQALVEEAEQVGDAASKIISDIVDLASDKGSLAKAEEALSSAISGMNLDEQEFNNALFYTINCLKKGQYPNIDALPFRNMYYSNIPGILDIITEHARLNGSTAELIEKLQEAGVKLKFKKKPVIDISAKIDSCSFDSRVKFEAETQALGRVSAFGLYENEATKFLGDVYMARMGGDTEASIQAGLEAEAYIAKLQTIQRQARQIVETYDILEQAASQGRAFKVKEQMTAYTLADGTNTDLAGAMHELAELMLPEDLRQQLIQARELLLKADNDLAISGKLSEVSTEEYDLARQVVQQAEEQIDAFLETTYEEMLSNNGRFMLQRLKGLQGSQTQTSYLAKLAKDTEEGMMDNARLLNSDRIFEQSLETPEQILKRIEATNEVSELSYVYNQQSLTAKEFKEVAKDPEKTFSILDTAKQNLAKYEGSPVLQSMEEILDIVSKGAKAGARLAYGYLHGIRSTVVAIEEILNTEAGTIRNKFIDLVHSSDRLKTIAKNEFINNGTILRVTSEAGSEFTSLLRQAVEESISAKLPVGSFGSKFDELFDAVNEKFVDYLRQNPNDAFKSLTAPQGFNAETDTAEQITEAMVSATKQKGIYDNVLDDLFSELSTSLTKMQARLLNEQANTLALWERCLATPGKMSEVILGDVTMTWLPTRGASASIENLAGIDTEFRQFMKELDSHDFGNVRLSEWAFESSNFEEIKEAVAKSWLALTGKLTDEELKAFEKTVANTQAGRVAEAFLNAHANVQKLLFDIGSEITDTTRLFNGSKLAMADSKLTTNALSSRSGKIISFLSQQPTNTDKEHAIAQALQRLLPASTDDADLRKANLAVHFFEVLDLDKHFGKGIPTKIGLNRFRDNLLNGVPLQEMYKEFDEKDVTRACRKIVDGLMGNRDKTSVGLIAKMQVGSKNISEELASHKSKYIEDLRQALHYKSAEHLIQDLKDFGYDDLKSWFEASVGGAKKAYAVMSKAGAEPFQYYQNIMDMAIVYANNIAHRTTTETNVQSLRDSLSPVWRSRVNFAVNQVCGTYTVTPSVAMRIAQSIIRAISAPMLMKAGFKSLTDYSYQYQYLATMGLRSSTSLQDRLKVYEKLVASFSTNKDMLSSIYLNQHLRTNIMYELIYNEPISNGMLKKYGDLNEWAPAWAKLEATSKWYTDKLLNKLARIEPMTNYNRMNAALNVMQALGDFATTSFDKMPERLQRSLGRFDISANEWDNLFSKKAVCSVNEYVSRIHGVASAEELGEAKLFFPELLIDLSDDEVVSIMKGENIAITPENISRYRQALVDKASMIVNVSANEMTTIPTARIQGALLFGHDPNTWAGMGLSALTQFQSFGTGVTFYHWGRKIASHLDPNDELYNKIVLYAFDKSTAVDMAGFVAELAVYQFILNEMVAGIAGTRKTMTDEAGNPRVDNITEKTVKAIVDQAGVMGPLLDAIVTNFEKGRGQGGGIALSLLPSGSSLLGQVSRVAQAATKESTKDNRAQAVGAALIQNAAYYTGIPQHVLTQAAWALLIGDKLTEWQQGTNYNRYMNMRARNGYVPSWARHTYEEFAY